MVPKCLKNGIFKNFLFWKLPFGTFFLKTLISTLRIFYKLLITDPSLLGSMGNKKYESESPFPQITHVRNDLDSWRALFMTTMNVLSKHLLPIKQPL